MYRQHQKFFQETIRNLIRDIPGTRNLSDDVIVFRKDQQDHDIALEATFKRLHEKGVTLNREKCEFSKDQIAFYGLVFTDKGVKPDPPKIEAVQKISAPQNVSEVRSFLGMMKYCSRFIPDYATLCELLWRLTQKEMKWSWSSEQECAFQELKAKLTDSPVMA